MTSVDTDVPGAPSHERSAKTKELKSHASPVLIFCGSGFGGSSFMWNETGRVSPSRLPNSLTECSMLLGLPLSYSSTWKRSERPVCTSIHDAKWSSILATNV